MALCRLASRGTLGGLLRAIDAVARDLVLPGLRGDAHADDPGLVAVPFTCHLGAYPPPAYTWLTSQILATHQHVVVPPQ